MRKLFIAGFVVLAAHAAFAQKFPAESDRLIETGKLWITIKYFHPYLAYRNIDWDQALIAALPKIRAARTQSDYSAAVQSMLDALADPVTRVGAASEPPAEESSAVEPGQRIWIHNGLAPFVGSNSSGFYSAFQTKPGASVETATLPIGLATAIIRLSEGASIVSPAYPLPKADRAYPEAYPAVEFRILAAYKIWGVFHYFFAYRDLMDEDWDELLPIFLPRFIAAKDATEYNLTIAELLTHLADSQVTMASDTMASFFGKAPVGLRLQLIEKHAVVTQVLDPAAVQAGIKIGDIVKTVDGEALIDRFKREAKYVSASTPQSLGCKIVQHLLNGPEGSSAALTIEDRMGVRKEVTLKRSVTYVSGLEKQRTGDAVQVLSGNIGYADLDRLLREDINGMFEKLRDTRAIIFDLRGSSLGSTALTIALHLTQERDVPAAIFTGPLTIGPDLQQPGIASQSSSYFFVQTVPNFSGSKYKNRTIILIDERTQSAAEHAGLLLEVVNKTQSVGTSSAGADGDVSNFIVPGNITISFSGRDVRHANGGKLQRLGLQPSISAAPTIGGIRAGKDEVLRKALDYLLPQSPKTVTDRVLRSRLRLGLPAAECAGIPAILNSAI